jgi:hypothetical protein
LEVFCRTLAAFGRTENKELASPFVSTAEDATVRMIVELEEMPPGTPGLLKRLLEPRLLMDRPLLLR